MATFTLDTNDLDQLIATFEHQIAGMDSRTALVVRKAGFDVERYAKQYAPVDTGFLRSSIVMTTRFNGWRLYEATVTAEANYAVFVEHGTSRMAPQPFMGPALDRVTPSFLAALEAIADPLEPR